MNVRKLPRFFVASGAAVPHGPAPSPCLLPACREERYLRSVDSGPSISLWRWLLADSLGRWHLAVDTVLWDVEAGRYTYVAVQPFSVVRPLTCNSLPEVER
jgi:hypothetical protein